MTTNFERSISTDFAYFWELCVRFEVAFLFPQMATGSSARALHVQYLCLCVSFVTYIPVDVWASNSSLKAIYIGVLQQTVIFLYWGFAANCQISHNQEYCISL